MGDGLKHVKAVLVERPSGLDDIHYNFCQARERCEFDGAVELYDLDALASYAFEVIPCDVRVFGSDSLVRDLI